MKPANCCCHPGRTADIPEMWRNPADEVEDNLYKIAAKLSFIHEAAPFTTSGGNFSEAGLSGLFFVLSDLQDDVNEAGAILAEIRTKQEVQ